MAKTSSLLLVKNLRVVLPSGKILIEDFSLTLNAGEVVVLLGGSGAGKSTFSRVLFEPEILLQDGFSLSAREITFSSDSLGLVPQRGALFDHLDVKENIEIALRYGETQTKPYDISEWLERVGLDKQLAKDRVSVSSLSGGQAQRVAVARALAGGRKLLFLDEPSVGLDPHRVRMLARLIRTQCKTLQIGALVVTHDIALAGGLGDRLFLLDPSTRRAEPLFSNEWPGPLESEEVSEDDRATWMARIEKTLVEKIDLPSQKTQEKPAHRFPVLRRQGAMRLFHFFAPFRVASQSLWNIIPQLLVYPKDLMKIFFQVFKQALLRPLLFYGIVSTLIGYTVLYVISKVGGSDVPAERLIWQIGGSYTVSLAPVLSALLFVAASGSAINAWLGSIGLTRQTLALQALGISTKRYLFAPSWLALGVSYIAVSCLFASGMLLGGFLLCKQLSISNAWELLSADWLDPRPERTRYLLRALFLIWVYAWGIASDIVSKGSQKKSSADDVTRGMTGSVVSCTLWVVVWELFSAIVVFAV